MTGSRRVLRRLGWGAIGLIAVLALGVCAVWLLLASSAGQRAVLAFVQERIGDQIAGRISIDGASLSPRGVVELHGVTLRDPDGGLVARIGDLEARADLPALVEHHVRVELLRLARGELHLVNGPDGLNLSRALAPRTPAKAAPPPASNEPFRWDIALDRLLISEFAFDYRPSPEAPPDYALSDLTLSAHGRYGNSGTALYLSALGQLGAPLAGRLSLELAAEGGSAASPIDPIHIKNLELHAADAALHLTGDYRGGELQARIDNLVAPAEVVRAFAPAAPLVGALRASGTLGIGPRGATVSLAMAAGDGKIAIDGRSGFDPLDARATVTLERADLSELLDNVPATDLNGTVRASFAVGSPAPGRGEVELDLGPSVVRAARFSAITGRVTTSGMEARIESLSVAARGGELSLTGAASPRNVDVRADVELSDLRRFTGVVARAADIEPPALSGSARLRATVQGPLERLEVAVSGSLARFEAGSFKVEGVTLNGRLPNLANPRVLSFSLRAARGSAGELPFSDLAAKVQADRRSFSAEVSSAGLAGVVARLGGEMDANGNGGLIENLELATGGVAWKLENPVRLELASGFKLGAAALTSGAQRLELEGGLVGSRLDLVAHGRQIDLAKLPALFVPRSLGLAGLVDLDARVAGTTRKPQVDATAQLKGVGVAKYRGLDGQIAALMKDERLSGSIDVRRAPASRVQATFDVPQALLASHPGTPIAARVQLEGEPLVDLGRQLAMPQLAEGTFAMTAALAGTVGNPRLDAAAQVRGARWSQYPATDVDLTVGAGEDLRVKLDVAEKGGRASLELLAPLRLGELAKNIDLQRLRATPLEATLNAPQFDLAPLAGSLLPQGVAGIARAEAHLEGTLAHPRGELRFGVDRAVVGAWNEGRLSTEIAIAETGTSVLLELARAGKRIVVGRGLLRGLPEEFDSLAALARAPVELTLTAGPVRFGEALGELAQEGRGVLDGEFSLSGTLGAPVLAARVGARELGVRDQKLGDVALTASYAQRHLAIAASSALPTGGGARLEGGLDADLGLQALANADVAGAPLQARLTADALELKVLEAPLSGIVRQLGGRLDAHLDVTGTLRDPTLRGTARIRDGHAALVGFGSYRDLQADFSITDQVLALDNLSARSGSGAVVVKARALRTSASEPYQLDAKVKMDRFPVTMNDRVVASLDGETTRFSGQIQGTKMSFDLRLDGLGVELPEIGGGKNLQPLDAHPDFFIVRKQVRRAKSGDGEAVASSALDLKMHIEIPRDIQIESQDVRIEAGADLYLTMAQGELSMTGEVVTKSGRVEVMGRKFEIASGRVSYAGDPPSNPRLDVQALYENTREQVKVKVGVSGSAQKPHIEMSSEPPMDEPEIATLLATGRRDLKRGSGGVASGSAAYSVIGSFAAERLRKTIASQLPLDVLQVDLGDVASQGLSATKLEAGTYLTDRIYLGYRKNFGVNASTTGGTNEPGRKVENADEVRVEYQLSPSVTVESSFGTAGKGGADVVFTKDY